METTQIIDDIKLMTWEQTNHYLDIICATFIQIHNLPDVRTNNGLKEHLTHLRQECYALQTRRFELIDIEKGKK